VVSDALHRIAIGDRAAFRSLFEHTQHRLYPICLRLLRESGAAQDAMQESYARVWHCASGYRGHSEGQAWSWLFQIARSRCIDVLRERRRTVSTVDGTDSDWEAVADERHDSVEAIAESAHNVQQMIACLSKLTDKKKQAISLAFYEGCSYPEIAQRLSHSLPAVKSDVRRGLLELRRCLQRFR
jgi:RNA polymerase sigma-70 factor (ECF subfamily)